MKFATVAWKAALRAVLFVFILTSVLLAQSEEPDSVLTELEGEYYVIQTRHRVHTKFSQIDTVKFGEPFFIGEDEFEAEIITFNPHLGITVKGEALQMSDTLYNPAVRVRVSSEGEVMQESWGFFFVDSPHFYREDMLGFKLLDFKVDDKYIRIPK